MYSAAQYVSQVGRQNIRSLIYRQVHRYHPLSRFAVPHCLFSTSASLFNEMVGSIPASVVAELAAQAEADPQIPRAKPTVSFWQLPPHPTLSEVQSDELPESTDYAIIGSGVTGCSIATTLLEASAQSPKARSVTVFEARTLTSGATGRNGGVLASFVPGDYALLSERFGHDEAVKIARFANRTLEKMHQIANSSEELRDASEVRRTADVLCFEDEEAFQLAQESQKLYEEHVPEERNTVQYLSAEEAATVGQYSMPPILLSLTKLDRNTT